ncbi:hypothetical protein [Azohydromonas australica]|uniref:hypothetical protein n=1 Tax=Azohydromonas australica TaxID=364039 RepID=UPI001EE4067E|nr:hypothetical protein [Azohydromonas australica]
MYLEITMNAPSPSRKDRSYQLRFNALDEGGRALVFPCDAKGQVDIDSLSESARNDYFFARAVVGGEFTRPCVQLNG